MDDSADPSALARSWLGRLAPHRWRLWSLAPPVRAYVLMVDAAALLTVLLTADLVPITSQHWMWGAGLAAGSVLHLEAASGIERIREVAAEGSPHTHMQSVWLWAGLLLLPPPLLAGLIAISYTHSCLRVYGRRAILHRKIFSAATVALGCAAAATVLSLGNRNVGAHAQIIDDGAIGLVVVTGAGCLYWLINYAFVVGAILMTHPDSPGRTALGHGSDQLIIAASIGLGTAMAVLMTTRPWWAPLLLVTILALHLGLLLPQFRSAANYDRKTGLLDGIVWGDLLERELDRARRLSSSVAVLFIDVDHFKQANDTYGHLAGDATLRAVVDAIKGATRRHDLAGRLGGDEIGVAMPGISLANLKAAAERIRIHVSALTAVGDVPNGETAPDFGGVTVSIGAALYPDHATTRRELQDAADAALYEAKRNGRNQVRIAQSPIPQSRSPLHDGLSEPSS